MFIYLCVYQIHLYLLYGRQLFSREICRYVEVIQDAWLLNHTIVVPVDGSIQIIAPKGLHLQKVVRIDSFVNARTCVKKQKQKQTRNERG